ncbi:MAG: uncharacterized protein QG657_5645 [Acidobacteriota bacterium]|nr:uncharacterized protein [Acidobacteriota bacterium]
MEDFLVFFVTRLVGIVVILAVGIYILQAVRILYIHPYLVYRPTRKLEGTPRRAGLEYREIFFKTKDGVLLNAWFIPAEDPKAIALHCHGNSGNISERLDTIKIYHDMGISLFLYDYRGYGNSGGKPSEKGTYKDAEAAWYYLVKEMGINPGDIIITGHSLGGSVAFWLAGKVTPKALIIEGSFTSMTDMGKLFFPHLPIRLLVRHRYNSMDHLKKVHCPVLIIHSPGDKLVPFYMGRALYRAANPPKRFLEIHGSHNNAILDSREEYTKTIMEFIDDINGTTSNSIGNENE